MRKLVIGFTAIAVMCFAIGMAGAEEKAAEKKAAPDATIELKGGSFAAGIGFSWGGGTLKYQDKEYPISADGLTVGEVGITNITASGKVYNLKSLEDFDGNYTGATAGATAAGGGGITSLTNQKGVKIDIVSTTQGAKLSLAVGGVKMKIKK
jgi:hypothetical protein